MTVLPTQIQKILGHYNYPKVNRLEFVQWVVHEVFSKHTFLETKDGGLNAFVHRLKPMFQANPAKVSGLQGLIHQALDELSDYEYLYVAFRFGLVNEVGLSQKDMLHIFGILSMKKLDAEEKKMIAKVNRKLSKHSFMEYLISADESVKKTRQPFEKFIGRFCTVKDETSIFFKKVGVIECFTEEALITVIDGERLSFSRDQLLIKHQGYKRTNRTGQVNEAIRPKRFIARKGFRI